MTYTLYYASADREGSDSTWSVWQEKYASVADDEPIDGTQEWVSQHATEAEAYAEARRQTAGGIMRYVLLTDSDNGTALVACRDAQEADRIAAAAVFSDGGVSAWIVPDLAIVATDDLYDQLRDGHDTSALDGDRVAVKVLLAGGEIR